MANSRTSVQIEDEEYSLLSVPHPTSALVLREKEELTLNGSLDLETLVKDLAQVGGFIRIAYYATAGAGPSEDVHKLQMQIQDLGFEITDLCTKSAVTVANFRSTTRTILQELKAAYQFLLDGFEDMAVDSMASLSALAQKMADAALELEKDFKQQEKKVIVALKDSQGTTLKKEIEKKKMEEEQRDLDRKITAQKEMIKNARRREEKAVKDREMYERSEDEEIGKIKTGILESVCNVLTSTITVAATTVGTIAAGASVAGAAMAETEGLGTMLFGANRKDAIKRAALYKQKALQNLALQKEYRQERQAHIQQRDDFLAEMKTCEDKQDNAETAAKFLHEASGALKQLAAVMHRAAVFWQQLQQHCQFLAEHSIKDQIEKGLERYTEEKRLKFWTSPGFKTKAVSYYAKWVALQGMCNEYMGHLKITQEELLRYIQENPTREQAKRTIDKLIDSYRDDLKREQDRMVQRGRVEDGRIEMLEQAED